MIKENASIYIGNNFLDSQLLYIIPFVHGYAKNAGINRLVFEREFSNKVRDNIIISEILKNYDIEFLERGGNFPILIKYINRIGGLSLSALGRLLTFRRKMLLDKINLYSSLILHSIWDRALLVTRTGKIKPGFLNVLESIIVTESAIKNAERLISRHNVKVAIVGHTVYAGRALIARLMRDRVRVICQSSYNLYDLDNYFSIGAHTMNRSEWEPLYDLCKREEVEAFWCSRSKGETSYFDASLAAKGFGGGKVDIEKNVIFLHVFRDSPFNIVDRNRIFIDYYDWVDKTLRIISDSKENWLFKIHPNAARWGEDSLRTLRTHFRHAFGNILPKNIRIDDGSVSNLDILINAKKVVTFAGTVHLESACLGIRAITVSQTTGGSASDTLVHKPRDMSEYRRLLLDGWEKEKFSLPPQDIRLARTLLYLREKVLTFSEDIGAVPIYRGDGADVINDEYRSIAKSLPNFKDFFVDMGSEFYKGLRRSVGSRYHRRYVAAWKDR